MSLSLQPAVITSPLNGLPVQPVDGAASQPLSFEEVLKVEEKKLQQEVNAQSAAALLATLQQPAIPESIQGFDAGNLTESARSVDQAALTTDSVQSATTQPVQNALLPQQAASPANATAKTQSSFSMPIAKAEQPAEVDPNLSFKLQTEPRQKEIEIFAKHQMTVDESQDQATAPFTENKQPATIFVANTEVTTASVSTTDVENLKAKTGVKISVHKDESISTSKPVSAKVTTANSSESANVTEKAEMLNPSEPARSTVSAAKVSTTIATQVPSESTETISVEDQPQKIFAVETKPAETNQTKTPVFAASRPIEKPENPVAKTPVENFPVAIEDNTEAKQKILAVETKPLSENDVTASEMSQMKAPINVTTQPVSKSNTPTENMIYSDITEQNQTVSVSMSNESDSGISLKKITLSDGVSTSKTEISLPQQAEVPLSQQVPDQKFMASFSPHDVENQQSAETTAKMIFSSTMTNAAQVEEKQVESQQKTFVVADKKSTLLEEVSISAEKPAASAKSDKPTSTAARIITPLQVNTSENETSQPVDEAITSNQKWTVPEIRNESNVPQEKKAASVQVNIPVNKQPQPMREVDATVKPAAPKANVSASDTLPLVEEAIVQNAKNSVPEPNNEPDVAKTRQTEPAQEDIPVNKNFQPVREETAASIAKPIASTQAEALIYEDSQSTKATSAEPVQSAMTEPSDKSRVARSKMSMLMQANPSEAFQPAKETVVTDTKITAPMWAEIPASEVPQLVKETVVPNTNFATPEIGNESDATKMKSTAPVQAEVPASEISQPVKETVAQSMNVAMTEPDAIGMKMAELVQSEVTANEVLQHVTETVAPNAKFATPEIGNKQDVTKMKIAVPEQVDALARSEVLQPAKETVAPSVEPAVTESDALEMKIAKPMQVEVFAGEIHQPVKETIAPGVKSVMTEPDGLEMKIATPMQAEVPASEIPQSVKEPVVPNTKSAMPELDVRKMKIVTPLQSEILASEMDRPVIGTVAPSAKSAVTEPDAIEMKISGPVQEEVPASEITQPVKEMFVPSVQPVMTESDAIDMKVAALAQPEAPASEMTQPAKETVPPITKSVVAEIGNEQDVTKAKTVIPAETEVLASEADQSEKDAATPTGNTFAHAIDSEPGATKTKAATAEAETSASEISQSAKDAAAPNLKSAAPKIDNEPISTKTKMSVPVEVDIPASEISQPTKDAAAPTVKSIAPEIDNEPRITKTKMSASVEVDIPVSEISQPVKDVVAPTGKFFASEIDNEPIATKIKMSTPVAVDIPASEISQPAKDAAVPEISDESIATERKIVTPVQVEDVLASEMSQPAKETVVSTVKVAAPETSDEPIKAEKKIAEPVQEKNVSAREMSQPAKETVVPVVKVAAPEISDELIATERKMATQVQVEDVSASEMSQPVKEIVVPTVKVAVPETGEEPIKVEKKMAASVQVAEDVSANEMSQPAKETVVPTAKVAAPEPGDELIATDKKMTAPVQEKNVSVSEVSQPAKETVVPTVKVAAPEISDEPIATERKMAIPVQVEDVSANVMSQPAKEIMLKSKDDKAAPTLEFDNATAESRFGMGSRPQIKNETIAFEQGDTPVEIQPKKVEQTARVEIKSDEKVTAKEPALDLESNVVIAGIDKGIAGVDVVKKSSVAQVDPMAMHVMEQITSQMKARIKSGETSISMKLNPEKLGGIEVQMTHSAQGVSVSFITEQASTGQLIESQVNQLRQSLKDAGVQLANLNINQHGQSNQEGGGFRQSQQFAQSSRRDVPLVEDEGIQPQRVGLTSEIDYLV